MSSGKKILGALSLIASTLPSTSFAVPVTLINNDSAGEGLNDPTVVAAVGGNPETTLGAQRLYALQAAADLWAATLSGSVEVKIDVEFISHLDTDGNRMPIPPHLLDA